jgi:phage N-6-adenine-methyltransferase
MVHHALYSSASGDWETPEALFRHVQAEFGPLTLDVCATEETAKCPRYFDRESDGLAQPWDAPWWCNPPYGRAVGQWISRGVRAVFDVQSSPRGVFLLPARTDTAWFHDLLYRHPGIDLVFLRGRVRFVGATASAPFPSLLAVLSGPLSERPHTLDRPSPLTSPLTPRAET